MIFQVVTYRNFRGISFLFFNFFEINFFLFIFLFLCQSPRWHFVRETVPISVTSKSQIKSKYVPWRKLLKYHNYDFRLISVANGNVLEREVFVPIRIHICAAGIKGRRHLFNFETSPNALLMDL